MCFAVHAYMERSRTGVTLADKSCSMYDHVMLSKCCWYSPVLIAIIDTWLQVCAVVPFWFHVFVHQCVGAGQPAEVLDQQGRSSSCSGPLRSSDCNSEAGSNRSSHQCLVAS